MDTMRSNFVLTLTGPDRVGIVERVTRLILLQGGNVETSRMARPGGEFAILMLVSLPGDGAAVLGHDLRSLETEGYKLTTTVAAGERTTATAGQGTHRIEVQGADHEGIIHEVAAYLAERGINIVAADTQTTQAPVTAAPLFAMTALVWVPAGLAVTEWEAGLRERGNRLNLEIRVEPA
jgi:glycine cleavage system transcriptional repressor